MEDLLTAIAGIPLAYEPERPARPARKVPMDPAWEIVWNPALMDELCGGITRVSQAYTILVHIPSAKSRFEHLFVTEDDKRLLALL